MSPSETNELKQFLHKAAANGYASGAEKHRETDGSDIIEFADGAWRFHDNYFTSADGRRFYGREVVFRDNKPYWFMGYAGFVDPSAEPGDVYPFLKRALLAPDDDMPIRGPLDLAEEDWQYIFNPDESLEQLYASEWIKYQGKNVYVAHFHGGLID